MYNSIFPWFKHTAFYFPPSDSSDGPPFSPERETCCIFLLISFSMLAFLKENIPLPPLVKQHVLHRLENPSGFLPTCEALQGFTPTREWHSHSCGQRTCRSRLLRMSRSINSQTYLVHPCNSPDNKKRQRNFLPLFDIWRETLPMCNLKSDSLMSAFLYACDFPRHSCL